MRRNTHIRRGLSCVVAVVAVAAVVVPAIAWGAGQRPIYAFACTACVIAGPGSTGTGEEVKPSSFLLTLDGSTVVQRVRWSDWGGQVARGTGIYSASDFNPSNATGKRTKFSVDVTLSKVGTFRGHRVYRCMAIASPRLKDSNQPICLARKFGLWGMY
jgi:hypothetical protein